MVCKTHNSDHIRATRSAHSKRASEALAAFVAAIERQYGVDLSLPSRKPKRQILSAKQAAHLMRLSPKTLANWRNLGQGPAFYKNGGRVVYLRADVLAFCRSRKSRSTSQYGTLSRKGGQNDG